MTDTVPAGSLLAQEGATIVAQLRVRSGAEETFARWQEELGAALSAWPGFVKQTVMPPSPPVEARWTIFQWFDRDDAALGWLVSPQRSELLKAARAILIGPDDIHVARMHRGTRAPAPASTVIETRIKLGMEEDYRAWQHRIAAAVSTAPGFQGYRFEPPVAGVRDTWLTVVRFDTEAELKGWLDSADRSRLLKDAEPLTSERSARTVASAFEQWFPEAQGPESPAPWKMSMIVLSVLYPTVFLIDTFIAFPLLGAGIPSWLAIFCGNVLCVLTLALLVPRISSILGWWLESTGNGEGRRSNWLGVAVMIVIYAVSLAAFAAYTGLHP